MIRIVIVGVVADPVEYPDGSNTEAVEKKLLGGFGKGVLKHNSVGVLSETLEAGEYEYHVTVQGKTSIICSHSSFFTLFVVFSLSIAILYFTCCLTCCVSYSAFSFCF